MRSSEEFRTTVQAGCKAGRRTVVVHLRPAEAHESAPSRVGFVVSKRIGNAVTRNRVKRRLRHLVRPLLNHPDAPAAIVVRALPAAATEPGRLADDLVAAYDQAMARL